jgi:hypothetical protein
MFGKLFGQFIFGNDYALSRLAKKLLPVAAQRMGIDERELARACGGIRALENNAVNAHIEMYGGKFRIYVNSGFIGFVMSMLYLYSSRIAAESQRGSDPLGRPPPDLTRLARSSIHQYLRAPGWFGGKASSIKLNPLQLRFFEEVFHDVQCYAIAHELGHLVAMTSSPERRPHRAHCLEQAEKAYAELVDASAVEKNAEYEAGIRAVFENWADELEADLTGLEMLMSLHADERRSLSCIAVFMYLALGYTADVYREQVLGSRVPFSPTHPPNVVRLSVLYEDVIRRHSAYLDERFYAQFTGWTEHIVAAAKAEEAA